MFSILCWIKACDRGSGSLVPSLHVWPCLWLSGCRHNQTQVNLECRPHKTWYRKCLTLTPDHAQNTLAWHHLRIPNYNWFRFHFRNNVAYADILLSLLLNSSLLLYPLLHICKKASSYIAQYPVLRTVQSALHFTSLTDLFNQTLSASLGISEPYATINARSLLVHISTTVYSQVLIYSAEWTGAK